MRRRALDPAEELRADLALVGRCFARSVAAGAARALEGTRATAWIGSGLSRIAADLGRRSLLDRAGTPGTLFTPLDYCASRADGYLPVLVTYGGKNLDIHQVGRSILRAKIRAAVVLTGTAAAPVARSLRNGGVDTEVVTLPDHEPEHRFVAIRAAWGLAAMAQQTAGVIPRDLDAAYERAARASAACLGALRGVPDWRARRWILLGGGSNDPAAIALEVLLGESGLATASRVDLKDFTHGRYNALHRGDAGLVLLAGDGDRALARTLQKRFAARCPVLILDAAGDPFEAVWEHLFAAGFLVTALLRAEGASLERPLKPSEASRWANWGTIRLRTPDRAVTSPSEGASPDTRGTARPRGASSPRRTRERGEADSEGTGSRRSGARRPERAARRRPR